MMKPTVSPAAIIRSTTTFSISSLDKPAFNMPASRPSEEVELEKVI